MAGRCRWVSASVGVFALLVVGMVSMPSASAAGPYLIDATGGDCATIGIWDGPSLTCTLTVDVLGELWITGAGVTLDGDSHEVGVNSATSAGGFGDTAPNATVKNTVFIGRWGFYSTGSQAYGNTFNARVLMSNFTTGNTLHDNLFNSDGWTSNLTNSVFYNNTFTGQLNFNSSTGNEFYNNNALGTFIHYTGNSYHDNWYARFDTPGEGCHDSGGDGICDSSYSVGGMGVSDPRPWVQRDGWRDADGDAVFDDVDNCPSVPNADQADLDGDGAGDVCDDDVDGDGVLDAGDNCPVVRNGGQRDRDHDGVGNACDPDIDGDGVLNTVDNCPRKRNADQRDRDGDGVGNRCDPDVDGDLILNTVDNCRWKPNALQNDRDRDGVGNKCDPDVDGDGVLNRVDNCRWKANVFQKDWDGDGVGNKCDPDCDGDGVLNGDDAYPYHPLKW